MKTLTLVEEIYNYIEQVIKPSGWAYMSKEDGYKKYVPFIAFLAFLSPESFPFKCTLEELSSIVDKPDESIYHDFLNGGIHSSRPCFSIFKRDDGLYPETVKSLYVDFRQHFSLHNIPLNSLPEEAFKKLQAFCKDKIMPLEGVSFTLAGDFSQARYVKKVKKR